MQQLIAENEKFVAAQKMQNERYNKLFERFSELQTAFDNINAEKVKIIFLQQNNVLGKIAD